MYGTIKCVIIPLVCSSCACTRMPYPRSQRRTAWGATSAIVYERHALHILGHVCDKTGDILNYVAWKV